MNELGLPTFIIGGVQKAGTTALHAMFSQHPAIWMPSNPQETHFFDLEKNYGMGVDWYKQQFFHAPNGRVVGQTSPLYLFLAKVPERIATIREYLSFRKKENVTVITELNPQLSWGEWQKLC